MNYDSSNKSISLRKRLDPERADKMIVAHDYWLRRDDPGKFNLCKDCPQPPNIGANYLATCKKHQK